MMFSITVPLSEGFRMVLRHGYRQRPQLADEIDSAAWFLWLPKIDGILTTDAEAAVAARNAFENALRERRVRLQGRRDGGQREDINPADITRGIIKIFDDMLQVRDRGRTAYTYREVECYQVDLQSFLGAPPPVGDSKTRALQPREAAKQAVAACYPDGVPAAIRNVVLCKVVGDWLKEHMPSMTKISDDTIKRAAGRK